MAGYCRPVKRGSTPSCLLFFRRKELYLFFPIFTTIGLILAFFSVYMRRSRKSIDSELKEFWDRELQANSVRKQPLTDIQYVEPDFSMLPFDEAPSDDSIKDYQDKLLALKDKKIVNLAGVSNTDLKLKYGVANLEYLSSCDNNFIELVKYLYDNGFEI